MLVPSHVQAELRIAAAFAEPGAGEVIRAPSIFTLSQWVEAVSSRAGLLRGDAVPLAADHHGIRRLWFDAAGSQGRHAGREERHLLARVARNADRLAAQWRASPDAGETWADRGFLSWRKLVHATMQARNWLSPEGWMERLTGQLRDGEVDPALLPQTVVLAGFVELTLLERALLDALGGQGVAVTVEAPATAMRPQPGRCGYATFEEELSAAARWAGAALDEGCRRIGIMVNGLEQVAGEVRRIFENHFSAGEVFALGDMRQAPFSVSRTESLAAQPLVADALLLLRLAIDGPARRQEFPRISRLLLSRNWAGGQAEAFARASLERELRARRQFRWSLARVCELAVSGTGSKALRRLIAGFQAVGREPAAAHPARQLLDWLLAWGWPGDTTCQGAAQAQVDRLIALLDRLARQPIGNAGECLEQLALMCGEEQAPGPGGALSPVQVLTPEEGYGLGFERAWIANLTAENWPPAPIGNPLLGSGILRRVPRADHEGMLAYCERLTDALKHGAERVRFSWCRRLEDLDVSPSPLIDELPLFEETPGGRCTLQREICPGAGSLEGYRRHPWLEAVDSPAGLSLPPQQSRPLRDAVTVLDYQAACPLAAYLHGRLDARFEDPPTPFLDNLSRGNLVHKALEFLYRPCLGNGRHPARKDVAQAVDEALVDRRAERWLLPAEFEAMRRSLQAMLTQWLEFARDWGHGAVARLEWCETFEWSGCTFKVRIDRADRLPDGRMFLLDYKTGRPAAGTPWSGERLGDCQLPLYAVLLSGAGGPQPGGVATAHLRLGEMDLVGVTGDPGQAGRRVYGFSPPRGRARGHANWEEAVAAWRAGLTLLLDEFRAGDCRAQFFAPEPLKHAGLEILLRRAEGEAWLRERGRAAG